MKRLFRKDNRIARLIAMWLVFIMALTPFYEHSGIKNPTKASSGTMEYTLDITVTDLLTKNGDDTVVMDNTDVNAIHYHIIGDDTTNNMYYWNCTGSYNSATIKANVSGSLSYDTNSNVGYEYKVKVYTNGATPDPYLAATDDTLKLPTEGLTVDNVDDTYAIYVKVNSFSYGNNNPQDTASDTNNKWYLLAKYKLVGQTSADIPYGWDTSESVANDASLVQFGVVTAPDVFIGEISYYYIEGNSSDVTSYTETNLIPFEHSTKLYEDKAEEDGRYAGFVKYRIDTDETNYYYLGDVIEIDNTNPKYKADISVALEGTNPSTGNPFLSSAELEDGVWYIDASRQGVTNYQVKFSLIEANHLDSLNLKLYDTETNVELSGSVIAEKTTGMPGYPYYETTNINNSTFTFTPGVIYELRGTITDAAGNKADDVNGNSLGDDAKLAKLCFIDKSFKITSWKVNDVEGGSLITPCNYQQKLDVTVSSGKTLGSIWVYSDTDNNNVYTDGTDVEIANYTFSDAEASNKSKGVYTNSHQFMIPATEGIYDNVKVYACDSDPVNGNATVTVSSDKLVYDITNPVVTCANDANIFIYKKNAQTSVYEPLPADQIVSGQYSLDTGKSEEYRLYVKVEENIDTEPSVKAYYYAAGNVRTPVGDMLPEDPNAKSYGYYYLNMSTGDLITLLANTDANRLLFEVEVIDDVNLNCRVTSNPEIIISDKTLRIDSALLTVGNTNQPVDIFTGAGNYSNSELFKLTITASSGYPITLIEAIKDVTTANPTGTAFDPVVQATFTEEQNTQDPVTKRYSVTATIVIPSSVAEDTLNLLLEEVHVKATDNHTPVDVNVDPNEVYYRLGTLLYDATDPVMTDVDTGLAFVADDGKWYKALAGENYIELDAKFTTGPQNVDESTFEEGKITYVVENTAANDILEPTSNGVVINNADALSATANVKVPESKNAYGTKVTFSAVDKAGNALENNNYIVRKIDGHNPRITSVKVNGNESNSVPLSSAVKIDAGVWDNLAIDKIVIDVNQLDGTTYYSKTVDDDLINYDSTEVTKNASYEVTLPDGSYKVTVKAYDMAGWESIEKNAYFTVDSTAPVVDATISAGTAGKTDYFYKSNVTVALTCTEKHSANITVTDNGTPVSVTWKTNSETGVKEGTYTVSTDGLHTVKIEAKDGTGNAATADSVAFIKDTKVPVINAMLNGAINYSESDGVRVFTANTTLAFSEKDDNKDANGFYYQMTKTVPDETPVVGKSDKTPHRSFSYTDEAEYTVNVYSVDMANNVSATKTVRFRIDKTAPSISIGGIGDGGSSSNPVTVSLNMQELYWSDATGTVEIYMKSGEGFGEELIEEIPYTPTGRNTSISRSFAESGIYRIEFNAQDSAGHTATTSSSFTIDTEVPVVTLEGVANYDVTDKDVTIASTITDKFYASKKVTITGSVTDDTGKVTPLTIDNYSATANPTVINETFSEDGIYDLTITCVDIVGNTDSKSVHFIIDKTDPVIGDLSDYEDKILTSFVWDKDLDELVSDLTVCDVHMYLNGQEYNGEDAVEDGSYILLITAEDELGHLVEKEVKFTLDTKAPVFIVTGVEDEESRIEPYNISVSLQLEEDTLTSVTLNDKVVTINGNTATFSVTEIGEYKLYMEAVDEAGNVSSAEYEFELEAEKEFDFGIIIAIVAVLLVIIIFLIIRSKSKKK